MDNTMMLRNLILSGSQDPFFNLAFENYIFSHIQKEDIKPTLYLWRNSDVVVIGRFQNPWKECSIEKMNAENVALMRRDTGGGAVFHDAQNLCFTFVGSVAEDNYRAKNSNLVCTALATLGIIAEPSGRNDILVNGSKISGAAFREKDGKYIHHGTLLIGTDLTRLANYLNPDEKKLASKGITSVRSRVTNLKTIDPSISIEKVIDVLFQTFSINKGLKNKELQIVEKELLDKEPLLKQEYERLNSWDWRFGKSPSFTHSLEGRFDWGGIEINFVVKNAIIEEISVFSDALDVNFIQRIKDCLEIVKGQPYEIEEIKKELQKNFLKDIANLC